MSELLQEAEKVRHTAAQHYRAYQPKPLTKQDIDQVEILFGGLHWRAERLIQATLENLGYRARPLPAANKADLLLGRELADIGQCCPTSFTTGNLAHFLRKLTGVLFAHLVAQVLKLALGPGTGSERLRSRTLSGSFGSAPPINHQPNPHAKSR